MSVDLSQCVPARVLATDAEPVVEWRHTGGRRFTEPFFADTIQRLPVYQTSMAEAASWADAHPGLPPRGFIFHMSRCGSTLLSQMLTVLPENRVMSEPPVLDDVLAIRDIPDEQRIGWLRAMVSGLGQPSRESEKHLFIKWDCWLMPHFPLIRRAFPQTPWVFLYREPIDVLLSHVRKPGAWIMPVNAEEAVEREGSYARKLARICDAAIESIPSGGALVNYSQLPEAACVEIPAWFGVSFSPAQREQMLEIAHFDAKTPALPFHQDEIRRRRLDSEREMAAAERWLLRPYATLERLRSETCI